VISCDDALSEPHTHAHTHRNSNTVGVTHHGFMFVLSDEALDLEATLIYFSNTNTRDAMVQHVAAFVSFIYTLNESVIERTKYIINI